MGKGDKKSKRGKIIMGSYGIRRSQRPKKVVATKPAVEKTVKKAAQPKKEDLIAPVEAIETTAAVEPKPKKTKKATEVVAEEKKKTSKKETTVEGEAKPKAKKTAKKAADEAPQQDLFSE